MRRRVFIAINLPEKIKSKLTEYQLKWPELPCRWTKRENLHITLKFLGYLTDEELIEFCQKIKEIASKKKVFSVKLNKICYGPLKKPFRSMNLSDSFRRSSSFSTKNWTPRMIWAIGERIKEGDESSARVFNFIPHITLGRIKTWQFRQIEPEERSKIDEEIDLNFEVSSIEIMESKLKRGGSEYTILESFKLKE
jgi:2'-5' RNA ligase